MKIMCEYQRQISVSVVAQLILQEYCIEKKWLVVYELTLCFDIT